MLEEEFKGRAADVCTFCVQEHTRQNVYTTNHRNDYYTSTIATKHFVSQMKKKQNEVSRVL